MNRIESNARKSDATALDRARRHPRADDARDAAGGASNGIERNEILRTERKSTRARNRVARESCRAVEAAADEAVDEARVDAVDAARG